MRSAAPALTLPILLLLAADTLAAPAAAEPTVRVVLTFDDGPHAPAGAGASTTLLIADALERREANGQADGIKAVFFVQTGVTYRGGSRLGLEVIKSLKARGHAIGIHSGTVGGAEADHLDHVKLQRQGRLAADLDRARGRLAEAGVAARYVRPTFGHFDADVLRAYRAHGLKLILWDADSKDGSEVPDPLAGSGRRPVRPEEVIETLRAGPDSVAGAVAAGKRDIVVLFHDVSPTTAARLPDYLRAIRDAASGVAGMRYQVEFVTDPAEVERVLDARQDDDPAEAEAAAAGTAPSSGQPSGNGPTPGGPGMLPWAGAAAGFVLGLIVAQGLRRRRVGPAPAPELPLPVLETLAGQSPLTGAQAACVADRLQALKPADVERALLAARLAQVEAGEGVAADDLACLAGGAGLVEIAGGQVRLSSLGVSRLEAFRAEPGGQAWADFIDGRLRQSLRVTCPHCRTAQRSHWLRPMLGCPGCHRRFPLRESPSVTPLSDNTADKAAIGPPGGEPADRRSWRVAPVGVVLAAVLVAAGGTALLQRPAPGSGPVLGQIVVDHFGYRPHAEKVVVFAQACEGQFADLPVFEPGDRFEVRRRSDNALVFAGPVRAWNGRAVDPISGDRAWRGEFSSVTEPGCYYISVPGGSQPRARSHPFKVGDRVYEPVLSAAARVFFYQRCGTELPGANAGCWYHAACHCRPGQDLSALRWDGERGQPAGEPRDLHGGWHDAGDYGKYVEYLYGVFWDLMHAAEWYPEAFSDAANIPESGNGVPDVLDEVKHGLDWLLRMQLPDGSVLGKVGVTDYARDDLSPPDRSVGARYYTGPSTGATATLTAACAQGARLFRAYPRQYPGYAARLEAAAERAWAFLAQHPEHIRYADGGMGTQIRSADGAVVAEAEGSSDSNVPTPQERQLRVAAAAELFALTGKDAYRAYVDGRCDHPETAEDGHQPLRDGAFSVGSAAYLQRGLVSYVLAPGATPGTVSAIRSALRAGVERHLVATADADPYRAYLDRDLYNWGSNFHKASAGLLAVWAVKLGVDPEGSDAYAKRAADYLHYFHGRNPLGIVYLTNMGPRGADAGAACCVMRPYHAWFPHGSRLYDGPASKHGPVPGFVVGGPNAFYKGVAEPPKGEPPMKAYADWNAREGGENAWEVNEPQLGLQAAYTFLLASACRPAP